jgi:hypothetical protein
MKLIKGLDFDYSFFYHMIADGSKVLFLVPKNVEYVTKFINEKKCICEIFDNRMDHLESATKLDIPVKFGNLNRDLISIASNSFDYVVVSHLINDIKFPIDFLKTLARISKKTLLIFENNATLKKRIKFLFSGSIFNAKYNSNEDFWLNQKPWQYSYKDIRSIVSASNLVIEKGFYANKKNQIANIYDIKGYPNLLGEKFFLLLSLNIGGKIPSYAL